MKQVSLYQELLSAGVVPGWNLFDYLNEIEGREMRFEVHIRKDGSRRVLAVMPKTRHKVLIEDTRFLKKTRLFKKSKRKFLIEDFKSKSFQEEPTVIAFILKGQVTRCLSDHPLKMGGVHALWPHGLVRESEIDRSNYELPTGPHPLVEQYYSMVGSF